MKIGRAIIGTFVLTVGLTAFGFHEYHVSVTQMQFNPEQKNWEVSIRIFTDDLEKALSQTNNKRQFVIKNDDQNNSFIERYIAKHLEVRDGKNQVKKYRYLGKEEEVDATWIYLEIEAEGNLKGGSLRNSVLTDVFEDQVNMVNVKSESGKKTYLYKKGNILQYF